MIWVVVLLLLFIFAYITWRRPLIGTAIIIAVLPVYQWRLSLWLWPTTFLELLIVVLFLVWLAKDNKFKVINFSFQKKFFNPLPTIWRWLMLFWLLASISAVLVNPTLAALGLWRAYFLEPLMFFLVLIYELKNKKDYNLILIALAALLSWLFFLTGWQFFSSWNLPAAYDWPQARRLTAIFSYPNALSLLTAGPAVFFLGLWLESKRKVRQYYWLILFLAGVIMAYLAHSEGALLGMGVAIIFWLILEKKIRKFGIPLVTLFFLTFILFGHTQSIWQSVSQQVFSPQLDLSATSLEIRSSQWQEDWRFLQNNFFWGAGLNGYQRAVRPYHQAEWLEIYLYPHDIWLNFWTELGLLGLLAFLAITGKIIFSLRGLHRAKIDLAWPLSLFWLTWFVHGLVDVPYFKNDLSILFFVFLALTIFSQKTTQEKTPQFTL
ncbi:MAG: hypothetical protein C3F02_01885 [Parcubacteria group bacterium]|nr:MAG: hypothetical protein C3F02_01885 [Parcubacteria group bacterium]